MGGLSWDAYLQILDALPRLGIPEFWRFDGKVWGIYQLQDCVYIEVETSPTFPQVPKQLLYTFLDEAKEDEIEAVRSLRSWWLQLVDKDL
jgi:hypothetical protein